MAQPKYVGLTDAARRLNVRTNEIASVDTVLQHVAEGTLALFFRAAQYAIVELSDKSCDQKVYNKGTIYPLDSDWAGQFLLQSGDDRFIKVKTLPDAAGKPAWVHDADYERAPLVVPERLLYLLDSQIAMLERPVEAVQSADFPKWTRRTLWTLAQAACVLAGVEPPKDFKPSKAVDELSLELYENLKADVRTGKIESLEALATENDGRTRSALFMSRRVDARACVLWALTHANNYSIPLGLEILLPPVDPVPYVSLAEAIQPHIKKPLADLPGLLRRRVAAAFVICPALWDTCNAEGRTNQATQYDYQSDPANAVERAAMEWDVFMDAGMWWQAETVTPVHAAMLLSGRNPNTESIQNAESNTNDQMGPSDFRRLRNAFDGASNTSKTLKEWTAYARGRGLKIHSWIMTWELWVAEVERRNGKSVHPNELKNRTIPSFCDDEGAGEITIDALAQQITDALIAANPKPWDAKTENNELRQQLHKGFGKLDVMERIRDMANARKITPLDPVLRLPLGSAFPMEPNWIVSAADVSSVRVALLSTTEKSTHTATATAHIVASPVSATERHRIKNRTHELDTIVELAIAASTKKTDWKAVWAAYVVIAQRDDRPPPLLGYIDGEGVKYTSYGKEDGIEFDTRRKFAARFKRRA